jgi:hypothetical protein
MLNRVTFPGGFLREKSFDGSANSQSHILAPQLATGTAECKTLEQLADA